MAEAIRDGLRLEAIATDIAGDGDTALELLSINAYDIAVLDRDIPGPAGDEIAKRIAPKPRQHRRGRPCGAASHRAQECRVTWNRTRRSFWVPKPAVGRMNSATLIVCTPVSWLHLS